ncbi:hypothetical protein CJP74_00995 [Psittacicella melopsittaci]|uniref:HTH lysR-type domain-containing protein n=1 Tax=Psittacicella melopsittaci TaxID=2028576 RepID=A0A3A1Y7Y9_9GAMM|nr:LysR family transcriptional regulator [Psittacicella melopsittaci]RIY33755.1 hypothetical protein CJP74_00995 [Psittacicella melopsittaci]
MEQPNFTELNHFLVLAETGSFVKAGDKLRVSSSAISHSLKRLEERLGVRLFNRTTRSVTLTEAGTQLRDELEPVFKAINERVNSLTAFMDEPAGTIRICAFSEVAEFVIYPRLQQLIKDNPRIKIDLAVDNRFENAIAEGYDMGIKVGKEVEEGIETVQVSNPFSVKLIASPSYLAKYGKPTSIEDLENHLTVGVKLTSKHNEHVWTFNVDGKKVEYIPKSRLVTTFDLNILKHAILDGVGIGYLMATAVKEELERGELIELLPEYAIQIEPYYLYYSKSKSNTTAFKMVVDALRHKE